MLFGYGASAINPYLVNEIITYHHNLGLIQDQNLNQAISNYNNATAKGILKVMNKIGISTLHSYRGAQIFEALGLRKKFVDKYFNNTPSRIEGIGLYVIEKEISSRINKAFEFENDISDIEIGGEYKWRRNGEAHMLNPLTISKLQQSVRQESYETYKIYSENINKQNFFLR